MTPDEDDPVSQKDWDLVDRCNGTLFGNCIGDAIGLLTEFMTKETANTVSVIYMDVEILLIMQCISEVEEMEFYF